MIAFVTLAGRDHHHLARHAGPAEFRPLCGHVHNVRLLPYSEQTDTPGLDAREVQVPWAARSGRQATVWWPYPDDPDAESAPPQLPLCTKCVAVWRSTVAREERIIEVYR